MTTSLPQQAKPGGVRRTWSWVSELLRLLVWAGALMGLIWLLDRAPMPPLWTSAAETGSLWKAASWTRAWAAVSAQDPLLVVFSAGRAIVLALAWYQLGLLALGMVARAARLGRLLATVELLTLPPLRRVLWGAVGLSMSAGLLPATAMELPSSNALTMSDVPAPPGALGGWVLPGPRAAPTPPGLDGPPAVPDLHAAPPALGSPPDAVAPANPRPDHPSTVRRAARQAQWTVRPGDHFWAIAEAIVTNARPDAGQEEVAGYWLRLVEANRQRLPDPGNPDLVLPGMMVSLPPLDGFRS
ncbi:MAG: LysM peptidoglycan-binding domain-containing protein [Egibacteraceae bacterium]